MMNDICHSLHVWLPSKLNDCYSTFRVHCWCARRVQKQACYTHGCFQVTFLYYYYYFLFRQHFCEVLLVNACFLTVFLLYCFPRWVKRDSYLPVGSQNLKATTKVGIYRYFVRAVIKSWWSGIPPGYYECGPLLLSLENRRKIQPKEILSCLILHLLVIFTWQLEILVTTLLVVLRLLGIYR